MPVVFDGMFHDSFSRIILSLDRVPQIAFPLEYLRKEFVAVTYAYDDDEYQGNEDESEL